MKNTNRNDERELQLLADLRGRHGMPESELPALEQRVREGYRDRASFTVMGRRGVAVLLALALVGGASLAAGGVAVHALLDGWNIFVDPVDEDTNFVVFENEDDPTHTFALQVESDDTDVVLDAMAGGGMVLTAPMSDEALEQLDEKNGEGFEVLLPNGEFGTLIPTERADGAREWKVAEDSK